ncbi:MAG: 30S ribosomal protein S16 [Candidatus Levybacteria bacterium]|nr:30S ribosomal protein S16 [Candidatus Levybacteria bacterium]
MAVTIRLAKTGRKGEKKYRIVVKERRSDRDGRAIETLGWYEKRGQEELKSVNKERYGYWISVGAQPSVTVERLVK